MDPFQTRECGDFEIDNPLVSVIMVVKNGERFFPLAVESVMEQEYEPIEIIVVDGQSTDRTAEIAKSIKEVHYHYQQDLGLANARNYAIQAARGKIIAFLDSDDLWAPDKLNIQLRYLAANPLVQGTISWLRFIVGQEYSPRNIPKKDHYQHDQIGYTPSALVARRELFQIVGQFNPEYSLNCDADWFVRLLDLKIPFAVIPKILLYKRIHDTNLSLDITKSRNEMMHILRNSLHRKR